MNKIILLGHGVGVKFFIDSLKKIKYNFKVVGLITHPKEQHDYDFELIRKREIMYKGFAYNVFNVKKDYGIEILESEDVNGKDTIKWIEIRNPDYIFSLGCRNILKKNFLNKFSHKVLNIHTTPLPEYRGAASDSWMILNGDLGKKTFGCCHYIDEGIDTGDIIATVDYYLPKVGYPIDLFKYRMKIIPEIVTKSLKNLNDPSFKPIKQDFSKSTSFPRIFTPKDGRIKFDKFDGNEIYLFIQAFGYPFEGAFCFLEEKKINILRVEFFNDKTFHSYANGLIYGKTIMNEYKVCVKGGYLIIKKIEYNSKEISQNKIFRIGKFLK
tara:strand:- start:2265 stop:3239 length:975 start_codon:yes stop_codon:yes gene_type:complete